MAGPKEIMPPLPVQASARAHEVRFKPLPPQAQGVPQRPQPAAVETVEGRDSTLSSQQSLNVAILEAEVSVRSADDPLALVYRAAIESINERLEPALGPQALQAAVAEGVDTSPEATAERIVTGSTMLLARYQAANPQLQGQELIDRFLTVIRGGIEQGFNEARDILDGLQVLSEEIASDIDRTFALVEEGLERFRSQQLEQMGLSEPAVAEAESATTEAPAAPEATTTDPLADADNSTTETTAG